MGMGVVSEKIKDHGLSKPKSRKPKQEVPKPVTSILPELVRPEQEEEIKEVNHKLNGFRVPPTLA